MTLIVVNCVLSYRFAACRTHRINTTRRFIIAPYFDVSSIKSTFDAVQRFIAFDCIIRITIVTWRIQTRRIAALAMALRSIIEFAETYIYAVTRFSSHKRHTLQNRMTRRSACRYRRLQSQWRLADGCRARATFRIFNERKTIN